MADQETNLAMLRHDLLIHAQLINTLAEKHRRLDAAIQELMRDRSARNERDKRWDERFSDISGNLQEIRSIGKWILAGFGSVLIVAAGNFILNGGLRVVAPI